MAYKPMSSETAADRIEINDLMIRYAAAIDTHDWELLDTCFIPDAKIDYQSTGGISGSYAEARKWLSEVLPLFTLKMHLVGNTRVEIDGDTATSRTYVINPMGSPKPDGSLHTFTVCAIYADKLVRTDEGWRIAERVEENVGMLGDLPDSLG